MSALSDALKAPRNSASANACKFMQVFNILDEEDKTNIEESVSLIRNDVSMGKSKQHSSSWLAKVLRSFGHDISVSSVQRHVNKECSCERIIK